MYYIIIVAFAFVIDLVFGETTRFPHPIVMIGKLISTLEKLIKPKVKNQLIGGGILALIVVFISTFIPFGLIYIASTISPSLEFIVQVFFCYQIIATRSLRDESMKVYYPLEEKNIFEARRYVSYIVGRDTTVLDEGGIIKAAVETIAENTTDGVIAPIIFMAMGGAPLGFLYKSVNTMDSMIGYKNDEYILFGRFAAKSDDILNFIPARASAILMILASFILKLDYKNAYKIFKRDRFNHKSPNSGQTESVCAGALGIQLAGPAMYFGKYMDKPFIGDYKKEVHYEDIKTANTLMIVTSLLCIIILLLGAYLWI